MSQFVILPGEVLYPIMCPQGLVLKEVNGIRQYPVEEFLGEILKHKVGMIVEENVDFEVIERVIPAGQNLTKKTCLLCNKGEILGGSLVQKKNNDWYVTVKDIHGNKLSLPASELIPIQHAQRVESKHLLENIKWLNIEQEFKKEFWHILDAKEIVNWFKQKLENGK